MKRRAWLQTGLLAAIAGDLPCLGGVEAAPPADDPLLLDVLSQAGPLVRRVLAARGTYEPQIIWTRLKRLADGSFQKHSEHRLGVQRRRWFTAASFVKLPLAALLMEQLDRRSLSGDIETLRLAVKDSCAALPVADPRGWSIASLLRGMLIVSDNRHYNALYELLGSDRIHQRLASLGYTDLRMPVRMGGCGSARKAAAMLSDARGLAVWNSPARAPEQPQRFAYGRALKGRAWQQGPKQIAGAHDFSASNFIALEDLHQIFLDLTGVVKAAPEKSFSLSENSRATLRTMLSTLPRNCPAPLYPETQYPDNHAKFLGFGGAAQRLPAEILITNKNAESYGYIGDCALIEEPARRIAFAATAVVYVNSDGVLNDGRYEYAQVGLPFLRDLGQALLTYERENPA